MPDISLLGWFHTVLGIIALASGIYTLVKRKEISPQFRAGQIYLLATLVTALSALGIFQQGGFGAGHALAVLTLIALSVGSLAAFTKVFGKLSRYIQAASYSATLLFHSIPAITDGLLRLPAGDPVLSSIEDPVLKVAYLVLLLSYLIGLAFQITWIRKQQKI
jgi:uncharacterized membrane protein